MSRGFAFGSALTLLALAACSSSTNSGGGHTPTGGVTGYTDCKSSPILTMPGRASTTQGCIQYQYDGDSVLSLTHLNAAFNCCADSFTATFDFVDRKITITEIEWLTAPCDCDCLYDVDSKISGLAPGTWTIKVIEPYLDVNDAALEFTVNLLSAPSGSHCVARDHYPWGAP